jgi:ABC-type nickel/cobalt efflux system permease component RcnA
MLFQEDVSCPNPDMGKTPESLFIPRPRGSSAVLTLLGYWLRWRANWRRWVDPALDDPGRVDQVNQHGQPNAARCVAAKYSKIKACSYFAAYNPTDCPSAERQDCPKYYSRRVRYFTPPQVDDKCKNQQKQEEDHAKNDCNECSYGHRSVDKISQHSLLLACRKASESSS